MRPRRSYKQSADVFKLARASLSSSSSMGVAREVPGVIPFTKFENFGVIRLSYTADRQTNRWTRNSTRAYQKSRRG